MVEAKYNGQVVWPVAQPVVTTYVVVASSVYYLFSNSGNILLASGSNYAQVYGTVLVKENGETVNTLYDQRLDVHLPSGSPFYVSNNRIFGNNLGTTVTSQQESYVNVTYSTSASVQASTKIYQEANEDSTSTVTGEKVYDYQHQTVSYRDYGISFSANRYYSSSSRCPAYGGTAGLSLSAWHWEDTVTPWTQTTTTTHTFTSTASYTETSTTSGSDATGSTQVSDSAVISGSATGFSRSGNNVTIASYVTNSTNWAVGRSVTYTATVTKHDNTTLTSSLTIYQDPDSISATTYDEEREWASTTQTSNTDYAVTIAVSQYTSSSAPCPAGGGYAGIGLGGSHKEVVTRDYTDISTPHYTWVSGRQTTGQPTTTTGTAVISEQTITTDVPTLSISQNWVTYDSSNDRLVFDTRGTTTGSARNATVTATNGDATDSVTVYQQANTRHADFSYNMSVEILADGATLPGTAGVYVVRYVSERTLTYTYTSGASGTSSTDPYSATIRVSNCTVHDGITTVSGTGAFSIDVTQNPSTTQSRTIEVWLDGASADSPHATIQQDAYVAPVQNVATFEPYIWTGQSTGPYQHGHLYYLFSVDKGSLSGGTLAGVELHYKTSPDGAETTYIIGSLPVEDTSQSGPVEITGQNVPTWSSGMVIARFTITGTGGFDTVNTPTETFSL